MELFSFIADLTWIHILVLLVGLGLVIFEMFHPGFGAPGIIGGMLLFLGVLLTAESVMQAAVMVVILLAILGLILSFVLHSATRGKLSRKLILHETQGKERGYIGTEDLEYFVGKEGTVVNILRPSGIAEFDGIKLDVVSDGDFVQKGTKVKVTKVEGRRIVVREIL